MNGTWGWRGTRIAAVLGLVVIFLMGAITGSILNLLGADPGADDGGDGDSDQVAIVPEETPDEPAEDAGSIGRITVLPTTKVEWICEFTRCGHEREIGDTESVIGMAIEDLQQSYPGYDVRLFTREHVKLKRSVDAYCPDHFVLMLVDSQLCVYRTDETTLEPTCLMRLTFDPGSFDSAETETLIEGLAFNSLEEINGYLENAES